VAAILAPTAIGLRMELKTGAGDARYPGLLPKSLAVLDTAGLLPRTTVTSFRLALAAEAMREPRLEGRAIWLVARGVVQDAGVSGAIAAAQAAGVPMLGLNAGDCDKATVAACLEAGMRVGVWAVNDAATIARVLELGVEVFTTDDPVTALRLRG
jgi:glycerophosphoryl diester phosphodiesterase